MKLVDMLPLKQAEDPRSLQSSQDEEELLDPWWMRCYNPAHMDEVQQVYFPL